MLPVHNKIVKMVLTLITYIQNTELFHNSVLQISGVLFGCIISDFEKSMTSLGV